MSQAAKIFWEGGKRDLDKDDIRPPRRLTSYEAFLEDQKFWIDVDTHLGNNAYMTHPKFRSDWKPKDATEEEELLAVLSSPNLSYCVQGGLGNWLPVMMKRVPAKSEEVRIASFLGQEAVAKITHNTCVPIYQILTLPPDLYADSKILVMPYLRPFNNPPFGTVGEALDCFQQIIEGVLFLHQRFVAHRNLSRRSIMMDASMMYRHDSHPVHINKTGDLKNDLLPIRTRTSWFPRYFIIDFSRAKAYDPRKGVPQETVEEDEKTLGMGQFDRQKSTYNPFTFDVYRLGILIMTEIRSHVQRRNLKFLKKLLREMTHPIYHERPTIDVVYTKFLQLKKTRSTLHLQSPLNARGFNDHIGHLKRRLLYTIRGTPPVPNRNVSFTPFEKKDMEPFYGRSFFGSGPSPGQVDAWKEMVQDRDIVPDSFDLDEIRFYH